MIASAPVTINCGDAQGTAAPEANHFELGLRDKVFDAVLLSTVAFPCACIQHPPSTSAVL